MFATGFFTVTSCNKSSVEQVVPTQNTQAKSLTGDAAKAVTNRLKSFYEAMKSQKAQAYSKQTPLTDPVFYTVDSLTFLMEGAFNMYSVSKNDSMVYDLHTFTVSAPMIGDSISEINASNAFWTVRDSLLAMYNNETFTDKGIAYFDLSSARIGPMVVLTVTTGVFKSILGYGPGCPKLFSNSYTSNHAFDIFGSNLVTYTAPAGGFYFYGTGQCDIVSGVPTSVNTTVPDARSMLKHYGIRNYRNCLYLSDCIYYINVSSTSINANTLASTSTAPYVSASIPGYMNFNKWHAATFYDGPYVGASVLDPDYTYKTWLTTPMMDFYASFIPGYIAANLPGGRAFYDFNIKPVFCLCAPHANDPDYPGKYVAYTNYSYEVTSGIEVNGCEWIGISNM